MALRKITRRRVPLDGTIFVTTGRLEAVLYRVLENATSTELHPIAGTMVPLYVRMEKHDDGSIEPVVRIGSMDSPEMLGLSHYDIGFQKDFDLYGWACAEPWLYYPHPADDDGAARADASYYLCDKCGGALYRDDKGERYSKSACIFDGELVCRDCDVRGLVVDGETRPALERTGKLAAFIGGEAERSWKRRLEDLEGRTYFGHPCQTRISRDGEFSFYWSTTAFTDKGKVSASIGGLIKHGPNAKEADGEYTFSVYDYARKVYREASPEEIAGTQWSIHT